MASVKAARPNTAAAANDRSGVGVRKNPTKTGIKRIRLIVIALGRCTRIRKGTEVERLAGEGNRCSWSAMSAALDRNWTNRGGDPHDLFQQGADLSERHHVGSIGERLVGIRMHLHEQSLAPCRHRCARERRDKLALARRFCAGAARE